MDEVKEMISEWLKFRNDNEEREFKISEDAKMRNEQVRRDFAEQGRMYDPYYWNKSFRNFLTRFGGFSFDQNK